MEHDDILERLQEHLVGNIHTLERKYDRPEFTYKDVQAPIKCRSGGSLSVQASKLHYCEPRSDVGPYTTVEVGAVHGMAGVRALLGEYHEEGPKDTDAEYTSVFPFVPIEKVAMLISMNGGIEDENG